MNTCFYVSFRFKDIDRATNAKFALEQKQRDEAKDRKEKGVKWETMVINTEYVLTVSFCASFLN